MDGKFKINQVVYDTEYNEAVRISKGIIVGGAFVPTEARAVRVTGIGDDGKPVLAFTYRKVNMEKLQSVAGDDILFSRIFVQAKHFHFIGRV